ncbi:hypothetical protein HG536_0A04920 [Torulaspora globosa]|uniref:Calcineurin-like phosphoesterase domain-containing protein n=1 Tax=Torulaspora globosa TaxID=48254 RepID=A0A7G3ZAZ1_9SACH|nr:uncharacterized protein HG536_0A04920 [Torulaspora globosa]QLL30677.1 hypothetical protein HG536_0A04920 [Torulaspora globosa]
MKLRIRRIARTLRRVAILLVLLFFYFARSSFIVHVKNTFYEPTSEEYRYGLIDEVRSIRCYRWYRHCGTLFARQSASSDSVLSWSRISKNLTDESLYSIESTLFYMTFLYVHQWEPSSEKSPITELAISRHSSLIPIQVTQDVQKLIKVSDSSVFHDHIHRQEKNVLNIFGGEQSDLDIVHSLGEDWQYNGGGIWCKRRTDQSPITSLEIYLGSGFHESRPNWKEVIHEYDRSLGSRRLPLSVTREISGPKEKADLLDYNYAGISLNAHGDSSKILQVSDVHFRCSDETAAVLNEFQTKHFISDVITREWPDLVVITGDFLDGQNSLDYQTCIMKLVQPMIRLKIPYVFTLGTSDHSRFATGSQIRDFLSNLPFCINKASSSDGHTVMTASFKTGAGVVVYAFDSFQPIKPFLMEHEAYKHYKYALAFRHLPIPEYRPEGMFPIIGQYNEQSNYKSKLKEEETMHKLLRSFNVKAMSCGHEHSNDCCLQSLGDMWLCYAGSSGVGIDRANGMEPSVRLFKVDDVHGLITSWKRNFRMIDSVYDYQYIFQEK